VRNSTLLKTLLRQVRHCDTEADLLDVAITIVQQHFELQGVPPFTAAEIAHTVESVWKIDQEGRNWVGQEAHIMIRAHEFLVLQESPDALTLYMRLLWAHAAREEEPFAISPKAMARDESITGWTYPRRYIQARDWLLEQGFLAQEHVGGSKPGDANLYRLTTPPAKGDKSSPIGTADFASQASDSEKAEKGDYGYPYIRKHPAPLIGHPLRWFCGCLSYGGKPTLTARIIDRLRRGPCTRADIVAEFGVGPGQAQTAPRKAL
jgi:hypothetical protein